MITVPQSVLAYYQQLDVQTAIDLLRGSKDPKVPPSLRWDQVEGFYRARLAALQMPIEYAIFLETLWRAVWTEVPSGWKPRKPSEPARPDLSIGVATIWDEGCFSRRFERGDHALELMVGLDVEEGLQVGVLLYDGEENVLLNANLLEGWVQHPDVDTYWTEEPITPLSETIAIEPFRRWTDQAWVAVAAAAAA